jgi:alpha-glucan,water dikinase
LTSFDGKTNYSKVLSECRNLIMKLKLVNNENTKELSKSLTDFGINEKELQIAFECIKEVWASKYNERAYISTSKIGVKLEDIRMAILVQKIAPADYAFVIHTKNPSNNDENELYAEMVIGMGETLVGKYEGQSLSFTYNKSIIKLI